MKEKKKSKNNKSNHNRIIMDLVLMLILLSFAIICYFVILKIEMKNKIYYQETSNLDYKVFLNENDFYDQPYLEKDKVYITNLISKIDITFDYDFKIDCQINLDFSYDLIGKIVIKDESEQNVYFEKEYDLLKNQKFRLTNSNYYKLKETISIDYNHYNELAKNFGSIYGVNTNSSLQVYLRLSKTSEDYKSLNTKFKKIVQLNIPLSKKSIQMKIDDKKTNNINQFIEKSNVNLTIKIIYILASIFVLSTLMLLGKIIYREFKPSTIKSKYDKYIEKLLIEYDRVIAETTYFPNILEYNVIQLTKFEELLDVRDNLKLPIMYYCIEEHQKAHFYIKSDNDLYLVTIDSDELK